MTLSSSTGRTDIEALWNAGKVASGASVGRPDRANLATAERTSPPLSIADAGTLGAHAISIHSWALSRTATAAFSRAASGIIFALIDDVSAIQADDNQNDDDASLTVRGMALNAVDSLRRWLGYTDEQVAELAGIAPRSISNWRNSGRDPYPSTVRQLFEIHNLIAALVRRIGLHATVLWLSNEDVPGRTRLDVLRGGSVADATRDAARLLFPSPRTGPLRIDDEEDDQQQVLPNLEPKAVMSRARGVRATRRQQ